MALVTLINNFILYPKKCMITDKGYSNANEALTVLFLESWPNFSTFRNMWAYRVNYFILSKATKAS